MVKMLAVTALALVLCGEAEAESLEQNARLLSIIDCGGAAPEADSPMSRLYVRSLRDVVTLTASDQEAVGNKCVLVQKKLKEEGIERTCIEILHSMRAAAAEMQEVDTEKRLDMSAACALVVYRDEHKKDKTDVSRTPREKAPIRGPAGKPGEVKPAKKAKEPEAGP